MNKNLIIFGAIGVFALMIVSAAVVNYLSNTAITNVDVDHAMEVSFATIDSDAYPLTGVGIWSDSITLDGTTQLSTSLVGVQVDNNADVAIEDKYLALTVSNELADVSCEDITNLKFLDTATEIQLAKGFQELESLCEDNEDGTVIYNIPINSLAADTVYEYPAKITFGVVEPTKYTFSAQMVVTPEHPTA